MKQKIVRLYNFSIGIPPHSAIHVTTPRIDRWRFSIMLPIVIQVVDNVPKSGRFGDRGAEECGVLANKAALRCIADCWAGRSNNWTGLA